MGCVLDTLEPAPVVLPYNGSMQSITTLPEEMLSALSLTDRSHPETFHPPACSRARPRTAVTLGIRAALTVLFLVTAKSAESTVLTDFEEARELAKSTNKLILVEFRTETCPFSAAFEKNLAADPTLQKAIDPLLFVQLDSERAKGKFNAARHEVKATPTFLLASSNGTPIHQWRGYGSNVFLHNLQLGLADTTSVLARVDRLAATPNAHDAEMVGYFRFSTGNYTEAVRSFALTESFAGSRSFASEKFEATFAGVQVGQFSLEDLIPAAMPLLQSSSPREAFLVASAVERQAARMGNIESAAPVLERAFTLDPSSDSLATSIRVSLEASHKLVVGRDPAAALALRQQTLGADWENDPDDLNNLAWWCFERRTELPAARQWAEKAVAAAPNDTDRAIFLDTLAEIVRAEGDIARAAALMDQAVTADSLTAGYKAKLMRFREEEHAR